MSYDGRRNIFKLLGILPKITDGTKDEYFLVGFNILSTKKIKIKNKVEFSLRRGVVVGGTFSNF